MLRDRGTDRCLRDAGSRAKGTAVKGLTASVLLLLGCGPSAIPTGISDELPPEPEVRLIADHEFSAVTGIPQGPFGWKLEGNQWTPYDPFRRVMCGGYGDPDCTGPVEARRAYLWEDGSDLGDLRVRVTRHTYPLLADQPAQRLSVRPPIRIQGGVTGLSGDWWIIWRDTLMVETAPLRVAWEIDGRWRMDSVTVEVAGDLPRKIGTQNPREFPESWRAADGTAYYHPAEAELAVYEGTVMRAGLGDHPQRYGETCWPQALRPVCARMDPVVVVTVHGEGEVELSGRRWQRGSSSEEEIGRRGRPDDRGHAIFRHLVEENFTGGAWFFAGRVEVRCDGGAVLEVKVAELQRRDALHVKVNAVAAFAWVFADCRAGTVTTMRERYAFIP